MARIAYGSETGDGEREALAAQIRAERGGKVGDLYRMLLNSPPVCRGWLNLLTAIRQQSSLPGRYREMVIIRIAVINGAEYEKQSHIPHARKEGLSDAQIEALALGDLNEDRKVTGFDLAYLLLHWGDAPQEIGVVCIWHLFHRK